MNVLFLFSDQHRADLIGIEKHPDIITPNMDYLASRGIYFKRAYCQDAICVPSRSSIFSGLYPRTLGCLDNSDNPAIQIIPLQKLFQLNGYFTAAFGKRHLIQACDDGWIIRKSHLKEEQDPDNYMDWIRRTGYIKEFARDWAAEWGNTHPYGPEACNEFTRAPLSARVSLLPNNMTPEAYTKNETISQLKKCAENKEPFFIFASFLRPHQPYTPLPSFFSSFNYSRWGKGLRNSDAISKPSLFDQNPDELPIGLCKYKKNRSLPWNIAEAHDNQQLFRYALAAYYAGIIEIDFHIGEIIHTLEKLNLIDKTIVIYTSDHGEFAGNHGLMEKSSSNHNLYEECLRVPLIISCPAILPHNIISEELIELIDIYPTLVDLCHLKKTNDLQALQGTSLKNHIERNLPINKKFLVSENWSQATVITKQHKLGIWLQPEKRTASNFLGSENFLFDKKIDPFEEKNLIKNPEYSSIKKELYDAYELFRKKIN
ncbi:MAG TPA: sulfatase-like hydrolase/transferase [Victivallales bacterium]|nr:sulfatase-like hydrolase/transferase [Victivallales bacterium]